jgi:tripartite-type tricarboxylate transporter receptor subunit TctC
MQRFVAGLGCMVSLASVTGMAQAAAYPERPIRMIVASAPGGGTDLAARIVGQRLSAVLGQQVIIDNRAGAAGNIAADIAAKSQPDGYTLVMVSASHAINASLYRKLPYDTLNDFAPVSQVTGSAYVFSVHPAIPAKAFTDFIPFAKARKGKLSYASSGNGQAGHLAMELLKTLAGFEAVHVPYKGGGPAMIDLIAGQVDAFIASPPAAAPHVKTGKVRALAVTSMKRIDLLPDVPTIAESGFPQYEVSGWNGLLAPARTPAAIVNRLQSEIAAILKQPDAREIMASNGLDPVGTTPAQFSALIKNELGKWAKVVKQSGASAE